MNRREALATLAAVPGLSVTPISVRDASESALVLITVEHPMSAEQADRIHKFWARAVEGTRLQGVKAVVVDSTIAVALVKAP